MSSSTVESGLIGGTKVNVTPEKRIPKKHKYIKPTAFFPILPGNEILLNEDNDDNPETTDTSLTGKYDISQIGPDNFTEKQITKKLQIMMKNTRRKHQKLNKLIKVLIIMKHHIICVMIVLSRQPKKEKH